VSTCGVRGAADQGVTPGRLDGPELADLLVVGLAPHHVPLRLPSTILREYDPSEAWIFSSMPSELAQALDEDLLDAQADLVLLLHEVDLVHRVHGAKSTWERWLIRSSESFIAAPLDHEVALARELGLHHLEHPAVVDRVALDLLEVAAEDVVDLAVELVLRREVS